MPPHTHDGIDWVARLADLRRADEANGPALRAVADRLVESLPAPQPTVYDVGCGAGGMSAALAEALAGRSARSGGSADSAGLLVLVDAVPELLAAASEAARAAVGVADVLDIRTAHVDLADVSGQSGTDSADSAANADGSAPNAAAGAVRDLADRSAYNPARGSARDSAAGSADGGTGSAAGSSVGEFADGAVDVAVSGGVGSASAVVGAAGDSVGSLAGGSARDSADAVAGGSARGLAVGAAEGLPHGVGGGLDTAVPAADLIWASNVAHHLPDQRQAVAALVEWLAPGGCLALSEGGLSMRCLPWDLGVGEPGLQDRLIAAHGTWFHRMRTEMPDAVRLPVGWNQVLTEAGLSGVTAFSYLVDVPAPLTDVGRAAVVSWLAWMTRATSDLLDPIDVDTLNRLLDQDDPAYVGRRDDVFVLKASTVYLGRR